MLIFRNSAYSKLIFGRAYFRNMLIFETVLIIARVRYHHLITEILFVMEYYNLWSRKLIVDLSNLGRSHTEIKLISFWNAKIQIFEGIFLAMNTEQVVFWQNSI